MYKTFNGTKKWDNIDKLKVTCGRWSTLSLNRSNNPDAMGNWHGGKKLLPRSEACHACGAIPLTVQEYVWTNLQEKSRSWKCVDYNLFYEDGIAHDGHLQNVPMQRDKTAKKVRQKADDEQ